MTNPLDGFVDRLLSATSTESPFAVGKVTAVAAGAAADGNALVTVSYRGASLNATYNSSYTPAVGHIVFMARTQPLFILGRVVGTPPS